MPGSIELFCLRFVFSVLLSQSAALTLRLIQQMLQGSFLSQVISHNICDSPLSLLSVH